MSKSLIITKQTYKNKPTTYYLTLREWYFQGDHPDYTRLEEITYDAAKALYDVGGISDHTGDFDGRNERYEKKRSEQDIVSCNYGKIDVPKAKPWWEVKVEDDK